MKRVYLVRHGESEGNKAKVFQGPYGALTEEGRLQAQFIGKRCKQLPLEALITSDMERAFETATIVGECAGLTPEMSQFFRELARPHEQVDLPKTDEKGIKIAKEVRNNFGRPGWRHSNEETFDDLKERAEKALNYLENRSESQIAVVSHGFFIRMLLALIVTQKKLTAQLCLDLAKTFKLNNTGLTVLEYQEDTQRWTVVTWNDHAHLADPN